MAQIGWECISRAVRGIGRWTSQYVLMRGHGLADCVPAGLVRAPTAGGVAAGALFKTFTLPGSLAVWLAPAAGACGRRAVVLPVAAVLGLR